MSEPAWLILWIAPAFFLFIASSKLIIEEFTSLVVLWKKLRATMNSEYSLEKGKLGPRQQKNHGESG